MSADYNGKCTIWQGCYDIGWGPFLVPEAYSHPAKVAFGLADRIYKHCISRKYITPGDLIVDPFGGIGGFAFHAMVHGLRFIGVELERKFVDLAARNFAMWEKRWGLVGGRVVCGDSRKLGEVIQGAGCVVSSPPYADCEAQNQGGMQRGGCKPGDTYGTTSGQLGSMVAGSVEAVVGSPPYSQHTTDRYSESAKRIRAESGRDPDVASWSHDNYGTSPGQLASLPTGTVEAACVVSSPPYEGSGMTGGVSTDEALARKAKLLEDGGHDSKRWLGKKRCTQMRNDGYGGTAGQLGETTGETFWMAAREIVGQCHAILRPAGLAVWVVKSFVKKGKIVDFPGQWRTLCEACGFEMVEEIHASLVKRDEHPGLFDGETVTKTKKRCSFFRRLHESKRPDLAIDHEVVLVMKTPGEET